ncbi:MAG: hypothetical protein ACOX0W_05535 [Sphaerochaetaceae bacterium]|jgi:hypothetical protein
MVKRVVTIAIIALLLVVCSFSLSARPTKGIALGAQIGAMATGVLVDVPAGPLAISGGINYPLLVKYIEFLAGESFITDVIPFMMVSADLSYPIAIGENFDLKFGLSTLAGTDFKEGIMGTVGAMIKGEYWLPQKKVGLFFHMDVPFWAYMATKETSNSIIDPGLPLLGIFTTRAGLLWAL